MENKTPSKLYKYITPSSIDKILGDLTIKFSSIVKTNDPFDANPNWLARRGFNDSVNNLILSNNFLSDERKKYEIQYLHDNSKHIIAGILANKIPQIRIFSLSESSYIPQMWAYYAQSGEGIVIEFDMTSNWFDDFKIAPICYTDEQFAVVEDINFAFTHKTTGWSHEQEWRMESRPSNNNSFIKYDINNRPMYLLSYNPKIVSKIILGYNISSENLEKVKKIVSENFSHVKIVKLSVDIYSRTFNEKDII